jgi:hypothetical protein
MTDVGPGTLVAVNVGYRAAKWADEGRLRVDAVEKVD